MDFRVFSRNISENMHARCVREDTKQALKGNLQADGVQSRQTLFVRYCHKKTGGESGKILLRTQHRTFPLLFRRTSAFPFIQPALHLCGTNSIIVVLDHIHENGTGFQTACPVGQTDRSQMRRIDR